jgi:hypothetical protein
MVHARDHLLADVATLAKANTTGLVEQHVMGEGIAQLIVATAFRDARRDAKGVPSIQVFHGRWRLVHATHFPVREACVAQPRRAGFVPSDADGNRLGPADLGIGPQPVQHQPARQIVSHVGSRLQ